MPNNTRTIEDLESPEHINWHQREWLAERIGWGAIAAVLAAALLGLLGSGPLSSRRDASTDGALAVEYEGIHRRAAPARLKIHFTPANGKQEQQLAISKSFSDAATIEQIVPEPVVIHERPGELLFTLKSDDASESAEVTIHYRYQQFGSFAHEVRIAGKESLVIRQWVLP
jgi:hypothetical protein